MLPFELGFKILENMTGLATAMLLLAQGSHGKKVYDLLTCFLIPFSTLIFHIGFHARIQVDMNTVRRANHLRFGGALFVGGLRLDFGMGGDETCSSAVLSCMSPSRK